MWGGMPLGSIGFPIPARVCNEETFSGPRMTRPIESAYMHCVKTAPSTLCKELQQCAQTVTI